MKEVVGLQRISLNSKQEVAQPLLDDLPEGIIMSPTDNNRHSGFAVNTKRCKIDLYFNSLAKLEQIVRKVIHLYR